MLFEIAVWFVCWLEENAFHMANVGIITANALCIYIPTPYVIPEFCLFSETLMGYMRITMLHTGTM